MNKKTLFALLFIFLASIPGLVSCEKKSAADLSSDEISVRELRRHMDYLASEETEGRMTASGGYKKAADYVVKHFKSFGLEPGWDGEGVEKTYYQEVPFNRYHYGERNYLTIHSGGKIERLTKGGNNYEIFYPGKASADIPPGNPVFVGYGIHEPDLGWDDFEGLDVKNKLAIIIAGFPTNPNRGPKFPREVHRKYRDRRNGDFRRFLNVIEKGASGVIAIPGRSIVDNWEYMMAERRRATLVPAESYDVSTPGETPIPSILLHADLVRRLFEDVDFKPITHEGNYRPMVMNDVKLGLAVNMTKETFKCYNLIGIIPGTDPELKDEFITVGAHLDHLGREGDVIYYGANDNASSCVLILEVAKVLARKPLRRPIVFILFTAEEIGHFGSLHYVAHPAISHDRVRLNINLEQIGARTRTVSGIWAIGPSSERQTLFSVRERIPELEVGFDDIQSQVPVISGSDTLSFYRKKLPAIIIGSGGFPEHHQPSDNIDLIDFDHLYKATLFVRAYIEELGNQ